MYLNLLECVWYLLGHDSDHSTTVTYQKVMQLGIKTNMKRRHIMKSFRHLNCFYMRSQVHDLSKWLH